MSHRETPKEKYVAPDNFCPLCRQRGKTWDGSDPKCAFISGEFSSDNWNCATAGAIRELMGEGWDDSPNEDAFYLRRDDQSYGALYVPPSIADIPDGEEIGPWRGGGMIAGYWYKHRGQTEMLIRVDPRDGGCEEDAAKRLTLSEAEAAIRNVAAARPVEEEK